LLLLTIFCQFSSIPSSFREIEIESCRHMMIVPWDLAFGIL
jgi:hypothetical protein